MYCFCLIKQYENKLRNDGLIPDDETFLNCRICGKFVPVNEKDGIQIS
jgi:hypothetical protein